MKRLILLRHAKAVPGGQADDHARDLTPRGLRDAAWAGTTIMRAAWTPDLALVSDARRTQRTFDSVAQALDPQPSVSFEPRLYGASAATILSLIAATEPTCQCLLVIGHNPGLAEAALRLAASGAPEACLRLAGGLPTAALAVFTWPDEAWRGVAAGGTLDTFLAPA